MSQFFSWLQSNYQYIIFSVEFLGTVIATVVAILRGIRVSDLRTETKILSDKYFKKSAFNAALVQLPTWIKQANQLYPIHGDGEKRFNYVLLHFKQAAKISDIECQSDVFDYMVRGFVNAILAADTPEKIYFKEDSHDEEIQSVETERSEDFPQNCDEEQTSQRRTSTFQRRN